MQRAANQRIVDLLHGFAGQEMRIGGAVGNVIQPRAWDIGGVQQVLRRLAGSVQVQAAMTASSSSRRVQRSALVA